MKVLLTATVQSHICQFHKPLVELLHQNGCEVHVAAKDNLAVKDGLKLDFVEKVYDVPFSRSPKSLDNIKAYKQLKKIIEEEQYDIIHCNTPMGGIITRLAAKKARKKGTKVFYTAHGFHFYNGASKKNWLIYYPIEKMFAKKTDKLITITSEDYALSSNKFKTETHLVHGVGVNEERYHFVDKDTQNQMREAQGLKENDFVVICTGELNKNKNQTTLIKAVAKIKDQVPNLKVLLAGNGPMEEELKILVSSLGLESIITFLGYRKDLEKFVPAVDVVVSCSQREGLPLNIVEGMLCKKIIIASKNRGHNELITDKEQGYLFNFGDVDALAGKLLEVYGSEQIKLTENAYEKAKMYTSKNVIGELKVVYGLQ